MKRLLYAASLVALMVATSAGLARAETIALQSSWYAEATNVDVMFGSQPTGPFTWLPATHWAVSDSSLIDVQTLSNGGVRFQMSDGTATVGQEDAKAGGPIAVSNWFYGLRFNWQSSWSDVDAGNHLQLEVWGERWDNMANSYSYDRLGVVHPGTGMNSGYSTIEFGQGYHIYDIHLAVASIPEPPGILALACGLSGLPVLMWRARRT